MVIFLDFKHFIPYINILLHLHNINIRMKQTITQHTQVNIACWKMHNILMGLYPNPPMKAAP